MVPLIDRKKHPHITALALSTLAHVGRAPHTRAIPELRERAMATLATMVSGAHSGRGCLPPENHAPISGLAAVALVCSLKPSFLKAMYTMPLYCTSAL